MSKPDTTTTASTDRLGQEMAQALLSRAEKLDPTIEARLASARKSALQAAAEAQRAPELVLQTAGASLSTGRQRGRWSLLLPAAVLVIGFAALSHSQWLQQTLGLADREAALLKDDLPPNAYGDPGFNEYLDEEPKSETPPPDEEEDKR